MKKLLFRPLRLLRQVLCGSWAEPLPVVGLLLLLLLLLLGSPGRARAQAPADGGPSPTNPTQVPLDGGASLLLLGGAGYAWRRLRRRPR